MQSAASGHIITSCTRAFTGRFRAAIMSITKTITRSTTRLIILKQSTMITIRRGMATKQSPTNTRQAVSKTLIESGRLRQSGTRHLTGESGTQTTARKHGSIASLLISGAKCAGESIRHSCQAVLNIAVRNARKQSGGRLADRKSSSNALAVNRSQPSIATDSIAPVVVRQVNALETRKAVYNLTVDGAHEYFANGVLVHNCDALRGLIWIQRFDK